jgi:hypothetical protein
MAESHRLKRKRVRFHPKTVDDIVEIMSQSLLSQDVQDCKELPMFLGIKGLQIQCEWAKKNRYACPERRGCFPLTNKGQSLY